MTALRVVQEQIAKIGYAAIERDYVFSDVFAASSINRTASLAAFTHTPASYRNAAIAVVEADASHAVDLANDYRALGAPLLFVLSGNEVTVWQILSKGPPRIITKATVEQLGALFSQNGTDWGPESIQRAKSIGQVNRPVQLDFVDLGLLPAIEGQIHSKLDVLLNETLAEAVGVRSGRARYKIDQRLLFRTIFRLLAAKVLQDRGHQLAETWNANDINSVLKAISRYYTLEQLPGEQTDLQNAIFASSWHHLRNSINFRNISADDLAFVYENTLISQETRKDYGTHGTPRTVAEYVVEQLGLWKHESQGLRIYEPFAGAGIFMVAALRHLRERLPLEWSDAQRHQFLVERIAGDEFDPFAKEVATLSLILADYPNANGWKVGQVDLFDKHQLRDRLRGANVVLCNPPFEDFTSAERAKYREAAAQSVAKPIVALEAALDASPEALGFVLPEPFIKGSHYREQRERVEKNYKEIELVALPDRTFKHSVIRSSLLIARERRVERHRSTTFLKSTIVAARDREQFLRCGEVTATRSATRENSQYHGDLWVNELQGLWDYLSRYRRVGEVATASRGIEWKGDQSGAISRSPKKGFEPGVHAANAIHAFAISMPVHLDVRPDRLRRAVDLPWRDDKLLANAARLSRGPWCFAAAIDRDGLVASQQLYCVWTKKNGLSLESLCAILNNPVAVAYIALHSPPDRIRKDTLLAVPIPSKIPHEVDELVRKYSRIATQDSDLFSPRRTGRADILLNQIDASILHAYDLPPRLERELLEYFRGEDRPTRHEWTHWYPKDFKPFIPLHEYLSEEYKVATRPWIQEVFTPLPPEEAKSLREHMD